MGADPPSLVASVITADAFTTQYQITCPSNVDASDCVYRPAWNVMHAESIYGATVTSSQVTGGYRCTLYTKAASSAECTGVVAGSGAGFPGTSTTTLVASDITIFPVTITAGLDKLASVSASTTSMNGGSKSIATAESTTIFGSRTTSGTKASTSANVGRKLGMAGGSLLAGGTLAFVLA